MSDSEPKPSKVLTKKMLGAHIIMVLVFPQLFIMGCIGLYVLTRAGSESVWAVTPVGIFFKWATSKNPATVAMAFNVGLFGTIYATFRLAEHMLAYKAEVALAKATLAKAKAGKKE